jgi:hypothetical protein
MDGTGEHHLKLARLRRPAKNHIFSLMWIIHPKYMQ